MNDTWDNLVIEAGDILGATEGMQIYDKLGRIASTAIEIYGSKCLKELSSAIKENCGVSRSSQTLANYAWVYDKTKDLELPPDISYRAKQHIAGSGRPNYWSHKIITEGLSDQQVIYMIREEKGLTRKTNERVLVCPRCAYEYTP